MDRKDLLQQSQVWYRNLMSLAFIVLIQCEAKTHEDFIGKWEREDRKAILYLCTNNKFYMHSTNKQPIEFLDDYWFNEASGIWAYQLKDSLGSNRIVLNFDKSDLMKFRLEAPLGIEPMTDNGLYEFLKSEELRFWKRKNETSVGTATHPSRVCGKLHHPPLRE